MCHQFFYVFIPFEQCSLQNYSVRKQKKRTNTCEQEPYEDLVFYRYSRIYCSPELYLNFPSSIAKYYICCPSPIPEYPDQGRVAFCYLPWHPALRAHAHLLPSSYTPDNAIVHSLLKKETTWCDTKKMLKQENQSNTFMMNIQQGLV